MVVNIMIVSVIGVLDVSNTYVLDVAIFSLRPNRYWVS